MWYATSAVRLRFFSFEGGEMPEKQLKDLSQFSINYFLPSQKYIHPTQKPVRLAERAITKNSRRGDIILDFCGGSGSTLIAAEQLERVCYICELDPVFCEGIIRRWEDFTKKEAEKIYGETRTEIQV